MVISNDNIDLSQDINSSVLEIANIISTWNFKKEKKITKAALFRTAKRKKSALTQNQIDMYFHHFHYLSIKINELRKEDDSIEYHKRLIEKKLSKRLPDKITIDVRNQFYYRRNRNTINDDQENFLYKKINECPYSMIYNEKNVLFKMTINQYKYAMAMLINEVPVFIYC